MAFHQDLRLRDEHELEHAAPDLAGEIPPHPLRRGEQTLRRLFEGEEDSLFAGECASINELEQHHGFAGPCHARNEEARATGDAVGEQLVQLRDARLAPRFALFSVGLAVNRHARSEDLDAARGDDERVLVAAVLRAPHFDDLQEPLLLARGFALRERHESIDDLREAGRWLPRP